MNFCSTHFNKTLKNEYNLYDFTRNCRIKNLNDFETDNADEYLWRAGSSNVKEKGMSICHIINRFLVKFLRRENVNVV